MRLRPLTEAECYTRCYGRDDESVRVVRAEGRTAIRQVLTGEALRQLFEGRLDERDPELDAEAA